MGTWSVDTKSEAGVMHFKLTGLLSVEELRAFVAAHNAAVDSYGARDYKVFGDIREMQPLSQECADTFELAKRHSSGRSNFRGSAIFVASPTVAMQHRRTSIESGVMSTELISSDMNEWREHLRRVHRQK